jgi:hypothetical protein
MPTPVDLFVFWTVRLAVALYLTSLVFRLSARNRPRWLAIARAAWTAGFIAFLIHVASAFHFVHHWSHAEAYAATAQQTQAVTGLNWGGGIYANYLFTLIWGGDVAWSWFHPARYLSRSKFIEYVVQCYLAFITFNATVIFGHGLIRWAGAAGFVVFGWVLWCGIDHERNGSKLHGI